MSSIAFRARLAYCATIADTVRAVLEDGADEDLARGADFRLALDQLRDAAERLRRAGAIPEPVELLRGWERP